MKPLPLTNAQRVERFGRFSFKADPRPGNPEAIRILGNWADENIVYLHCAQLADHGLDGVRIHRKAAGAFLDLWREWEAAGLLGIVKTWNGAWVPRFKRGKAGGGAAELSNHSWGTAFDINARLYPLGMPVAPDANIRRLIPIAEQLGWFWGGNFKSRPDGMHFEFVGADTRVADAARYLVDGGRERVRVIEAQRALGLAADGIVGPKTLARAKAVLAGAGG